MSSDVIPVRYKVLQKLGGGAFGTVYECLDNESGNVVAIKRIHKAGMVLSREYEILRELTTSRNCIRLLDCFFVRSNNVYHQHLVLEFVESDLQSYLNTLKGGNRPLRPNLVKAIGYQLFRGLCELEERNIMHRDLKPENVLKTKENKIKIADFGNAKFFFPKKHNSPYNVTQYYRAPELFLAYCDYDCRIDVWSAGCILAELVWGEPFFVGASDSDQLYTIYRTLGTLTEEDVEFYSLNSSVSRAYLNLPKLAPNTARLDKLYSKFNNKQQARHFFECIFRLNPTERVKASELIGHPFFDDVREEFERSADPVQ
jgi:glycogen synthase kinase 3 beta